jgi:hypothetical protein
MIEGVEGAGAEADMQGGEGNAVGGRKVLHRDGEADRLGLRRSGGQQQAEGREKRGVAHGLSWIRPPSRRPEAL